MHPSKPELSSVKSQETKILAIYCRHGTCENSPQTTHAEYAEMRHGMTCVHVHVHGMRPVACGRWHVGQCSRLIHAILTSRSEPLMAQVGADVLTMLYYTACDDIYERAAHVAA
eukprot:126740-Prymnesium_polylepis.2